MKAPQETTDKAQIGQVKELYPTCSNSTTLVWFNECNKVDCTIGKITIRPLTDFTKIIGWSTDGTNWNTIE